MKKILQLKLKIFAKLILWRYHPILVGITGSVGKTSTKEAVYSVLSNKYNTRRSIKNYNNEIGLPLTIIGSDSPGRNLFGWFVLFVKAFSLIIFKNKKYPQVLVLEMGVDRPGDMDYLNSIVKCDVGIITTIGESHIEYFGSIERIRKEKGKLIQNLEKKGFAIINNDNEETRKIINIAKARVITYGFDEKSKIRAKDINFNFTQKGKAGTYFKILYSGSEIPIFLEMIYGYNSVYAVLSAISTGIALGMNVLEITNGLKKYKGVPGRMNLLKGIENSFIIDDTYNASPQSTISAIKVMSKFKAGERKVAILGDMLELGNYAEEGHKLVGKAVKENQFDLLVTVGSLGVIIRQGALDAGIEKKKLIHYSNSKVAAMSICEYIKSMDIVLVKGSQGARMERIVKELLLNKSKASELLVRQGRRWEDDKN